MITRYDTKLLFTILILAFSVTLAGCSGDDSPTAPTAPDPDPVSSLLTTVSFTKIECLVDGDPVGGQGEFTLYCNLIDGGRQWDKSMTSEQSYPMNKKKYFEDLEYTGTGQPFNITFRATEWDTNILGDVYADDDMNNRSATANYTTSPDLATTNYITLGNSKCKVRLHYTISSEMVETSR